MTVPVTFIVAHENRTAKLLTEIMGKKTIAVILNFRFILTKHSSQLGRFSRSFMAVVEYWYEKEKVILEKVQQKDTKTTERLEHLSYEEKQRGRNV